MKVVIDTNVVLSGIINPAGSPGRVLRAYLEGAFTWIATENTIAELRRAANYQKVRDAIQLQDDELARLVDDLELGMQIVEPLASVDVLTDDPDDNMFLEAAVAGEADYIVSGDKHLIALKSFEGTAIVTPARILAILSLED